MTVTRRDVLIIGAGALASARLSGAAHASTETETHGISAFGDLKYPADFKQLEYVNVNAPKGGVFSQIGPSRQFNQNFLTFNSLNSYILKGDAAQGMQLTFATLMQAVSRRAGQPVRACGARSADFRRQGSHTAICCGPRRVSMTAPD